MSRSTLSVSEDNKDRFDAFKQSGETVNEAFGRLLGAATDECTSAETDDSDTTDADAILARLDDLQATLPKRTADEVENRLTRR